MRVCRKTWLWLSASTNSRFQIGLRLDLHPRGNFLGEEFEQEIGHDQSSPFTGRWIAVGETEGGSGLRPREHTVHVAKHIACANHDNLLGCQ